MSVRASYFLNVIYIFILRDTKMQLGLSKAVHYAEPLVALQNLW